MKKFMVVALVATFLVFAGSAYADEQWCGGFTVDSMILYHSDASDVPVAPCDLLIIWTFNSGQGPYALPAIAFGTQINLAILKMWNMAKDIDACLIFRFDPAALPAFSLEVDMVEEGSRTLPLPAP